MDEQERHTPCAACADVDARREFLKHAVALAVGALAGVAGGATGVSALPVAVGQALAKSGKIITYRLPAADGATLDTDNDVVLVRTGNQVLAFSLKCPHSGAELRWKEPVSRFECPRHDSKFERPGVYISGRAKRNMDKFSLRRDGDTVVVDASRRIQSDTDKAGWDAAVLTI